MSGLLYAGFDYGTTDDLPGVSWDVATEVEIHPGVGRGGGGAAFFNAALVSALSADLTWTGSTAEKALAYAGVAVKLLTAGALGITLAQIVTSNSVYTLRAYTSGVLEIKQDTTLLQRVGPVFSMQRGFYVEWGVRLVAADETSFVSVRVNGKTVLADIEGTSIAAEAFETYVLGGGTTEAGTFYADDVYVLDGVPRTPLLDVSDVLTNAGFLGDTRVEAIFPTEDGHHIDTDLDYTPWAPSEGSTHHVMVNEQPPDGGATNESTSEVGTYNTGAHTLDKYDTFQFTHPRASVSGFGLNPTLEAPHAPAPIYAIQLLTRMSTDAAASIRHTSRVVDDDPSTDYVNVGGVRAVTEAAYTYVGVILDRDPSIV